jgi:hypothetical protein
MSITKIARIVKRKDKYCIIGHKKSKNGKYRNFGCYDSKSEAKKRLGQIYMFKHQKAELIDVIVKIADEVREIHISDALATCIDAIASETLKDNTILKLGKIVCILQKRGYYEFADQLDAIIPELLCIGDWGCVAVPARKNRMTADKVYKIATDLKTKYLNGLIDEKSYEYSKMKELESVLKVGFLLPPPGLEEYKELPTDSKNWWEHFKNGGKNNG